MRLQRDLIQLFLSFLHPHPSSSAPRATLNLPPAAAAGRIVPKKVFSLLDLILKLFFFIENSRAQMA